MNSWRRCTVHCADPNSCCNEERRKEGREERSSTFESMHQINLDWKGFARLRRAKLSLHTHNPPLLTMS